MVVKCIDYSVSSDGKVYSRYGKELKQRDNGHGYLYVQICGDAGKRKEYVHRLVAHAFIANPENKKCVNHKDGDKANNCVSNLEWCTHEENIRHAAEVLGVLTQYQSANSKRKRAVFSISTNEKTVTQYESIRKAAAVLGVSKSGIISVLKGRQKTCAGLHWGYVL